LNFSRLRGALKALRDLRRSHSQPREGHISKL
jgi:hypothetical protein